MKDIAYQTDTLAALILKAKKVVVFTGAGVSTESGIPDFRSPGGIWSKYDPDEFTYQRFIADPEARKKQWKILAESGFFAEAKPNLTHYAIAELECLGKLDCVITQNVDNLHQKAGVPDDKVFELHGNMRWVVCLNCSRRYPFEQIKARLDQGEEEPHCELCHGILKPDAVFFGEQLPQKTLMEATYHSQNCDLFIVIGSTLVVYPAAYMPMYAKNAGAKVAIINLMPTDFDQYATVVIHGKAGEIMSNAMERVRDRIY
jgi:NAD-dependent deacetylase